jgi:ribosomal protein S6--L-glutamate ligase
MTDPLLIGWREWATLPELNIPLIKVKIDTGAKTSALHAYDLKIIKSDEKEFAEFVIHPIQSNDKLCIPCLAEIVGMKTVKSSNGHKQIRPVVRTPIKIGNHIWDIEITLTNRDIMHHRMLLGRTAMQNLLITPSKSYCQGTVSKSMVLNSYIGNLKQF